MNTTVIFAHPYHGSFNKAILDRVTARLTAIGDVVTVIDLYREGFDPVLSEADLAIYSEGRSSDPLVTRYNTILDTTERIVFIFPIWWYDMPAILRGFFDKVMLTGSAYYEDDTGIHPVRQIPCSLVISTSTAPTESLIADFGDPIRGTVIEGTFKAVGFQGAKWLNLGCVSAVGDAGRKAFLAEVEAAIK